MPERDSSAGTAAIRRAVVIGASGGIGAALADGLVSRGAQVERLARSAAAGAGLHLDLDDEPSIAAAAARVAEQGSVDLILVATGLLHGGDVAPEKSLRELAPDVLARSFAVNAIGPALVAKHFVPLLPRDARGLFAALSARVGSIEDNRLGGWYGYRASKAALNMLVRTLAIEVARTRKQAICVTLHPGTVSTRLSAPYQRGVPADRLFTPAASADALLDVLQSLTPRQSGRSFAWDGSPIPF